MPDSPPPLEPLAVRRPPHAWLLALFVLVVCLPPMTVVLRGMKTPRIMEGVAVASAEETWLRQRGTLGTPPEPGAWFSPSWGGETRAKKPPLVVWINMLAWSDLAPATTTGDELLFRARLVAIAMTGLMLVGVFAIGTMLGDGWMGLLAGLIAGTIWFVQREGRTGAYDIHVTAWSVLTVAWSLWAMRPFDALPTLRRRFAGWSLAGVCLAGAVMSKGPLGFLLVGVPVVTMIVLAPRDRARHVRGAVGMLILAAALILCWYVPLLRNHGALDKMITEYEAHRDKFQVPYYYIGVLGLVLPWTLWVLAGLAQPFTRAQGLERRRRLWAWLWFVILLVFFSLPAAKQQRYLLPLMPAIALVAAQVLRDHDEAARLGRPDPGSWFIYTPHWVVLLLASLLAGPLLLNQDALLARKIISSRVTAPVSLGFVIALTLPAVVLAGAGWYFHRRGRVVRAAVIGAVWAAVVSSFIWSAYAALPRPDTSLEPMRVAAIYKDEPVFYLKPASDKTKPINRQEKFVLFSRRLYAPLGREAPLQDTVPTGAFVIAEAKADADGVMAQNGFDKVTDFKCDNGTPYRLWKRPAN